MNTLKETHKTKPNLTPFLVLFLTLFSLGHFGASGANAETPTKITAEKPNVILVMADDQGWGQTSYNNHPILKTPNLDAMSQNGLRFDRFYAAAPVCSPTRAAVLTGRTNRRTGVESHGYALRLQEKTISQAMLESGYATGHFGKWHLNALRGPGVPILSTDTHGPGAFGFQKWLSVTNFFDLDPIMSRAGKFEEFKGDSSEIIVAEAIKFIKASAAQNKPSFSVIWYGTPHNPFRASAEDAKPFAHLDKASQNQHGELVAMDRSIGTLRTALKDASIADNTILWFTSDNGGLPKISPSSTGGLRGFKGSVYEGGLRVPTVVQWPAKIKPRITKFPAVSMDIFPTIAEIVGLPKTSMLETIDGISLTKVFNQEVARRNRPIPFYFLGNKAVVDENIKLVYTATNKKKKKSFQLFDLDADPKEKNNLLESKPELAEKMKQLMKQFDVSIENSVNGKDYPSGKLNAEENPKSRFWTDAPEYKPYFDQWKDRPEYKSRLKPKPAKAK